MMVPDSPYPRTIERPEEMQVRRVLDQVREDHRSRAVLLHGTGGVGKTSLVRRLADESGDDPAVKWITPIDVDDYRFWLLSNLERRIANTLDPGDHYFRPYKDKLARIPDYAHENISRETITSHFGRVKESFAECYNNYAQAKRKTIVIVFDTVETIRDTNLVSTLTQWMKALPAHTLFILSGRPVGAEQGQDGDAEGVDPIEAELDTLYRPIPVTTVRVESLEESASRSYIGQSGVSADLTEDEEKKLVFLTRGQPLWLAIAIDYLTSIGIPEEAEANSLEYIKQHIPYGHDMSRDGVRLYQDFLRRLVVPYRKSDFWHEAIRRLAVVRQPVDQTVWKELMKDLAPPDDVPGLDAAWDKLVGIPWIRRRGNGKFVTLHDAVAEAFADRVFPFHDQDRQWRRRIWLRALDIYGDLVAGKEEFLRSERAYLDARRRTGAQDAGDIIELSLSVDSATRELDQLKSIGLYYLFLTDFEKGCQRLLEYFEQAAKERDVFLQDLLVLYLQRFLPGGTPAGAFADVIKEKLDEFHAWLTDVRPDYYVAIGLMLARYYIDSSQAEAAMKVLDEVPVSAARPEDRYRMNILRGNACLRMPNKAADGERHFNGALTVAKSLPGVSQETLVAEALKERGYYYRNVGDWGKANDSYKEAATAIAALASPGGRPEAFDESGSIQANWAYVKGLGGDFGEALALVDTAVATRRKFGGPAAEGMTWSVYGEIYRYSRQFERAWGAYATAEALLEGNSNWSWLGLIRQQQAICLYQAWQAEVLLVEGPEPLAEAKRLIGSALDICLQHSIRGYPSALNRAGRIYGHDEPDAGLEYLKRGIDEARRLSDNWFLLANLVEYVELSYRTWQATGEPEYRENVAQRASQLNEVASGPGFRDLVGRWQLLQGHLAIEDYQSSGSAEYLRGALENYKSGFGELARGPVASSGAVLLPAEFEKFEQLLRELPPETQADWQNQLMAAWAGLHHGAAPLLARLQGTLARIEDL
ncbi:MAG TPA: ATP-binding protein [Trebonia sp.]|jgi:hypothetical protein|nr:ATP-binding protein [Trebonia sp.]